MNKTHTLLIDPASTAAYYSGPVGGLLGVNYEGCVIKDAAALADRVHGPLEAKSDDR